ncbi:hypothetical protein ACLE20_07885 [Rhizobium sp. YIM 134829]|uniref:hypothetical protein n=1 Tax=Rhizobium sp. YIM 134829 TaxID=3390453 RepID=UPI00397E5580
MAVLLIRPLILAAALAVAAGPIAAQPAGAPPQPPSATAPAATSAAPPTHAEKLDTLFTALKRQRDADKAREIADAIRTEWQVSGSASIDLLMQWAAKAIAANKQPSALDLYDQVIALDPDYVEGWNQRATLNFQMGNYRKSMSDINHVLALEPRHFGALAGMAAILSASGKDELALKAWERFLAVYPAERKAQEQLGEIEEKLAGNRT